MQDGKHGLLCGCRLHVVWEEMVNSGRITPSDFVRITSTAVAQAFNIYPRKVKFWISRVQLTNEGRLKGSCKHGGPPFLQARTVGQLMSRSVAVTLYPSQLL